MVASLKCDHCREEVIKSGDTFLCPRCTARYEIGFNTSGKPELYEIDPGNEYAYPDEDQLNRKKKIIIAAIPIVLIVLYCVVVFHLANRLSEEDLQGYWYMEDSSCILAFEDDEFLYARLDSNKYITGTYEIDGDSIILNNFKSGRDVVLKSVEVDGKKMTLKNEIGQTEKGYRISPATAEKVLPY
ncbi:MAG: hypothetical protein E7406_04260 [Ruminococcaceae bacterium]|nr:hypothetical protein [Oscillospiraceae bacterium]